MKIFYCRNFLGRNKYLKYKYSLKDLTDERIERMNLIVDEKKRENFLMAEFITIELLERMYGIKDPLILGKAGEKAYVDKIKKINFSRSYAEDNLVVAIDVDHAIGIDCEQILPRDGKIEEYFFTQEERDYVNNSSNKDLAFTVIWTRKESYMKYTGEGLMIQYQMVNTAPMDFNSDQLDTISSVLISETKLSNIQPIEVAYDHEESSFKKKNNLYVKSFIVNNTVISVTGEEESMKNIAYQEKRTYEEKNNRLFWKNSQSVSNQSSNDGQKQ